MHKPAGLCISVGIEHLQFSVVSAQANISAPYSDGSRERTKRGF